MSKLARWGVCCGLGFAGVVVVAAAQAQEAEDAPAPATSGGHEALQLTLQGSLVDYQKQSVTPNNPDGSSVQSPEQTSSTTGFGFLGSGLGVGVGYAWDQILFGARVNLTTVKASSPVDTSVTQISLLPRLEYMFTLDAARPFLAGIVGVEHSAASTPLALGDTAVQTLDVSSTSFAIGGAFGVHGFLSRSVSLDPEFTVMYAAGSGSASVSGDASSSVDYSMHTVRVLFSLGLSGWIDTAGAPTAPPPRAQDAEAASDSAVSAPPNRAPAAVPAANEAESKAESVDIQLPHDRRLTLVLSQDPASPSVLVRLTGPRNKFELLHCDSVAILDSSTTPIQLEVRTHGEHYLTGRLPIHGLEVLAGNPDANLSVCADQWQLDQPARDAVQGFLNARRDLLPVHDSPAAPPTPAAPPAPEAPATPPPAAAPGGAKSQP